MGTRTSKAERPVIVAWDTCTTRGVLAVGAGERLLAGEYFQSVKGHTGWLMSRMDSVLRGLGLSPSDIDYVAVGTGPGTFTGVKVGVACAKALSFGLKRPLAALATLDVLAAAAPPGADVVLSTIDARRGQLYAALYRRAGRHRERLTDFTCTTPEKVARMVAATRFKELAVVGESPGDLTVAMGGSGKVVAVKDPYPGAQALIELARHTVRAGELSDALEVSPIYLKKPT